MTKYNNLFSFSHSLLDNDGNAVTNVDMGIQGDALTWTEVAERFTEFLRGCGYIFDHKKDLGLVDSK